MAATRRAQPATHPTVYVGLALATVGLFLALYAYTGTRIYDVRFAFMALLGALLALAGIMTAAWGRAILSSRATRARRATIHDDAIKAETDLAQTPPTVAAPAEKKRLDLRKWARRAKPAPAGEEEAKPAAKGAFAFKRRAATPPPPAPPEERAAAPVDGAVATADAPPSEAPAAAAPVVDAEPPAIERLTVKCPRCSTQFVAEGVRPIPIQCPSCGLAGKL